MNILKYQKSWGSREKQLDSTDDDGGVSAVNIAPCRLENADSVKYNSIDTGRLLKHHDS